MAKAYKKNTRKATKVEEPLPVYRSVKKLPTVADFTYKQFEKIATQMPLFTQKDWANILHLSERTIQRYAKENKHFEGIYVDRILHIQEVIELGLTVFKNADALHEWLSKKKKVLGTEVNFESLYSTRGIQEIIDQLTRIQQGIYA
jgi:putative toxin-antitoxin system antitoxin component (TIGR02293 family)